MKTNMLIIMNLKFTLVGIIGITFLLFAETSSAGFLSDLLGPQLAGVVGSQLGYVGYGDYSIQLNNYYGSLPSGTICSYSYCNTDAASGAIDSRNLFSGLSYGLFGDGGTSLFGG
jgi:hypothetical protein